MRLRNTSKFKTKVDVDRKKTTSKSIGDLKTRDKIDGGVKIKGIGLNWYKESVVHGNVGHDIIP